MYVLVCRYRGTFVKRPYVWLGLGLQHTITVCTVQCSVCTVKTKRRRVNLVHFFEGYCICYAQSMDRDNPWIVPHKPWIRALHSQSADCPRACPHTCSRFTCKPIHDCPRARALPPTLVHVYMQARRGARLECEVVRIALLCDRAMGHRERGIRRLDEEHFPFGKEDWEQGPNAEPRRRGQDFLVWSHASKRCTFQVLGQVSRLPADGLPRSRRLFGVASLVLCLLCFY